MNHSANILISGAGPGGMVAALQLAHLGIESTLVDKAVFPRDKICGDALSGKVVEVLKQLDENIIPELSNFKHQVGSWGVTFISPNGTSLRVPFKQQYNKSQVPPGYISKRYYFDNFLLQRIKQNPLIDVKEGIELTNFEKTNYGFRCEDKTGSHRFDTKFVIAADGAQSRFARYTGDMKVEPQHYCAGVRAYYKNVSRLDDDNFIELHFLKHLLPGYFWIFPLPDGSANVGLGMRSDKVSKKKINLKKELLNIINHHPEIKKRFQFAVPQDEIRGFGLPLGSKKRNISGSNYLLTGDAASLIDPFTGEGIGNAMLSGIIAARHTVECFAENNFSAPFNKKYDAAVYDRLSNELNLSRTMQQLATFPRLFNFVVNKAAHNQTLKQTISAMFENISLRHKLSQPSFYINLLLK